MGGKTYTHTLKSDCYSDKGNNIYPDAEALAPALAVRYLSYLLLMYANGFTDAQVWELGDVSGLGKAGVGCWGLFDRLGKPKLPTQALMLLLQHLGAAPASVVRTWEDVDELVTGAFVSSFTATSGNATTRAATLAVVNAGTTTQQREILLVGDFAPDWTVTGGGYNCEYGSVVKSTLVSPSELRIDVSVPPSCAVVLRAGLRG